MPVLVEGGQQPLQAPPHPGQAHRLGVERLGVALHRTVLHLVDSATNKAYKAVLFRPYCRVPAPVRAKVILIEQKRSTTKRRGEQLFVKNNFVLFSLSFIEKPSKRC